ncbi:23S rRNA (guanine2445-N2)-methyltransferase / 23S rRNA (guanine2069-N7)-methyltransferase [Methylohalomonas lacus]|uniref:Ribosomal RNA large subunit methyltransferase K/L n=1 Tax=Methylohalomonas lacus TaxID=398773 RepID=A0AAE3HN30_9GAMM|nr:bifunctional 23S rRNA (guanine(2069)-N(7))-methyltransferase RlmK/23S rRNA (guanine(2445)-N(2))-methyltransferase RlmL [Methylohalomonas lacus]MCS3904246.1 23S rRNA (guanine2445-N2)-methyltransferase / 23S rRNA (guanine2069-N7)-methyltransferase [Methylohalomonas lacus]
MPKFFATAALGIEDLLANELTELGATDVHSARAGVGFNADMAVAYRVCLWSRLASRVLLQLGDVAAIDADSLYSSIQSLDWQAHIGDNATIAVDFLGQNNAITNTQFGAQKVKDAIVDQLRQGRGTRPTVDTDNPDVRINIYLHADNASVSIDLSGHSLHRRGYRSEQGQAPLKENLAAAILLRAGWPTVAERGGSLHDPMCGSGTLLIEGALMAADIAPGLLCERYGLHGWRQYDAAIWQSLIDEARQRRDAGLRRLMPMQGHDISADMIRIARANAGRAGLDQHIEFARCALEENQPAAASDGLLVTNPPYGERLGDIAALPVLYRSLGLMLKRCYAGWSAAILTGEPQLAPFLGMRAHKSHTLYNGALKCKLLHCEIAEQSVAVTTVAADFSNRLRKNIKRLGRWARHEGIDCYRVYDADLPEYNLAIDIYDGDRRHVHLQEFEAPASVDERKAQARLNAALAVIMELLEVGSDAVYFKQRRRQRGGTQYEKLAAGGHQHIVSETGNRFLVNFSDYLDTGLFLDHRPVRRYIQQRAQGRRFLNLFAYTGTATVCAVRGGAPSSVTVDMSKTYLDWAQRNLLLNELADRRHEYVQADVLQWLRDNRQRQFDLIFLDPPTFSRSKRMQGSLDVQRDHVHLIHGCMNLLAAQGELLFSTNLRQFRIDQAGLAQYHIEDISQQTIPEDFARNPRIHKCFRISHSA